MSISIHSLRVEGDLMCTEVGASTMISIHSLRVEGDYEELKRQPEDIDFNPLPPCGGRR